MFIKFVEHSAAAKVSKIWLQLNIEPSDEVFQHWKTSFEIRKADISTSTAAELYNTWPILKTQLAIELVCISRAEKNISEKYLNNFFKMFII